MKNTRTSHFLKIWQIGKEGGSGLIAILALTVSLFTITLQFSPSVNCRGLSISSDNKKLYLYLQNKGNISAEWIKGRFCITTNAEPESGKISDKKLPLWDSFEVIDNYYPTQDDDIHVIITNIDLKETYKEGFAFFSLILEYPQYSALGSLSPTKKYNAVFQYDKESNNWVKSSKNIYPEFFTDIFNFLRNNKRPLLIRQMSEAPSLTVSQISEELSSKNNNFLTIIMIGIISGIVSGISVFYLPKILSKILSDFRPVLVYQLDDDGNNTGRCRIWHSYGKSVEDPDASNKMAWEHTENQIHDGIGTIFGPYTKELSERGKYRVIFRIKVCGPKKQSTGTILTIDVAYGEWDGATVKVFGLPLVEKNIKINSFKDGTYKNIAATFDYDGESFLEFRCMVTNPKNYKDFADRILFDNVKVFRVREIF